MNHKTHADGYISDLTSKINRLEGENGRLGKEKKVLQNKNGELENRIKELEAAYNKVIEGQRTGNNEIKKTGEEAEKVSWFTSKLFCSIVLALCFLISVVSLIVLFLSRNQSSSAGITPMTLKKELTGMSEEIVKKLSDSVASGKSPMPSAPKPMPGVNLAPLTQQITQLSSRVDARNDELQKLSQSIATLQSKLSAPSVVSEKEKELQAKASQLEMQATRLTQQYNIEKQRADAAQKRADELFNRVAEEQRRLADEKRHAEEQKAIAARLQRDLEGQARQFETQKQALEEQRQALDGQKQLVAAATVKINELENANSELESAKNQVEAANQKLRTQSDVLEGEVKRQTESAKQWSEKADELSQQVEKCSAQVAELQAGMDAARYPQEFLDRPEFGELKAQVEEWRLQGHAGAAMVQAALQTFAVRESLDANIWAHALKILAQGITGILREVKRSETEIVEELRKWNKFLVLFSAQGKCDFSLKIPMIGAPYDTSYMHSSKKQTTNVARVLTWAVYHNENGLKCTAEVE